MQLRKRMVGVGVSGGTVAVGQNDARLTSSTLETVKGAVLGFNDEGDLVGVMDVGGLSQERLHQLGYKFIAAGMALLEGKLQIH